MVKRMLTESEDILKRQYLVTYNGALGYREKDKTIKYLFIAKDFPDLLRAMADTLPTLPKLITIEAIDLTLYKSEND